MNVACRVLGFAAPALLALAAFPALAAKPVPAAKPVAAAKPAPAVGDAAHGAQIFKGTCGVCHLAQPHPAISDLAMRIGPNLWGVVGRKAGTGEHFRYSAAMRQSGITWTPQTLVPYVHEPQKTIPNIRMSFQGLKSLSDAQDVVAYLQTFK